jgi:cytochrome bd ubiquinol oxidase subunit II
MSLEIVSAFLVISILLYCLLGGADFGAGILELLRGSQFRNEQQELIGHAMGPVWEANHMWLILAVVIFFNGFPQAYATLTTTFHIPLTLMLMGVVLRGCAFTFRSYDAVKDRSQQYYTWVFMIASVLTPFMLGTVAGALFLGRVPQVGGDFQESYVLPWCNLFSFSVGLLTCALFAFLAAVYLIGEAHTEDLAKLFSRRARAMNVAVVFCGGLVFLSAWWDGLGLIQRFASNPISLGCMTLATLILIPLWKCLHHRHSLSSRILAASQVILVLFGWMKLQYPVFFGPLTILNTAAPEVTLRWLVGALIVGCAIIFPALFYLLHIFKRNPAT